MATGNFTVDFGRTFASCLFMASAPKMKFQTQTQDVSASGEPKWEVLAACSWLAEGNMPVATDVVKVTVLGTTDPAAGIAPGTPVELIDLRVGVSNPERTDKGIRGGKPFYGASAIRPVTSSYRSTSKADAA